MVKSLLDIKVMVSLPIAMVQAMMTSQATQQIKTSILRLSGMLMFQTRRITLKSSMRKHSQTSYSAIIQGLKKKTCLQTYSTSREARIRIMQLATHSTIFQFTMPQFSMTTLQKSQMALIGVLMGIAQMNIMTDLLMNLRAWISASHTQTQITKSTTVLQDLA